MSCITFRYIQPYLNFFNLFNFNFIENYFTENYTVIVSKNVQSFSTITAIKLMIAQDETKSVHKRGKLRKRIVDAEKDEFCRQVRLLLTPSSLTEFVRFSSFGDSRRCPPCGRRASRWRKGDEGTEGRTEKVDQGEPRPRDISRLVKGKLTPSNVLIKATQIAGTLLHAYLLTRLPRNSIFAWSKYARSKATSSSSSILFLTLIVMIDIRCVVTVFALTLRDVSHDWSESLESWTKWRQVIREEFIGKRNGSSVYVPRMVGMNLWRNGTRSDFLTKVSQKFKLDRDHFVGRSYKCYRFELDH